MLVVVGVVFLSQRSGAAKRHSSRRTQEPCHRKHKPQLTMGGTSQPIVLTTVVAASGFVVVVYCCLSLLLLSFAVDVGL